MERKKYECCICHEEIERDNRLIHQKWGLSRLGDFKNVDKFDFCDYHFKVFENWIRKHRKMVKNNE